MLGRNKVKEYERGVEDGDGPGRLIGYPGFDMMRVMMHQGGAHRERGIMRIIGSEEYAGGGGVAEEFACRDCLSLDPLLFSASEEGEGELGTKRILCGFCAIDRQVIDSRLLNTWIEKLADMGWEAGEGS